MSTRNVSWAAGDPRRHLRIGRTSATAIRRGEISQWGVRHRLALETQRRLAAR
jgi:hypothetical protein